MSRRNVFPGALLLVLAVAGCGQDSYHARRPTLELPARVEASRARRDTTASQAAWAAHYLEPVKEMFTARRPRSVEAGEPSGLDRVTSTVGRCHDGCCVTYASLRDHRQPYLVSMCFAPGTDRIVALDLVALDLVDG